MAPRRGLVEFAERQQQAGQLLAVELRQGVGLVLGPGTAEEVRTVGPLLQARIVAGRDVRGPDPPRIAAQRAELHEVVARNAWIGGAAGGVIGRETLDHVAPERLFEVEHVMRDAQGLRAAPRVVEIVGAAA